MAQKSRSGERSGLIRRFRAGMRMSVLDRGLPFTGDPGNATTLTRDIWQLQLRMSRRQGKRTETDGTSQIPRRV